MSKNIYKLISLAYLPILNEIIFCDAVLLSLQIVFEMK